MRKAFAYFVFILLAVSLSAQDAGSSGQVPGKMVQMEGSFLQPLQERDSVLIADQIFYGFNLTGVEEGTRFAFPTVKDTLMTNIEIVSPWQLDTVNVVKGKKGGAGQLDLRGGITVTSFEEGIYILPPLAVQRMSSDGVLDTLVFEPQRLEIKTMPVDTATFKPHDIKGQIRYPVTFREVLPWLLLGWFSAALIILAVCLVIMHRRKNDPAYVHKDPAHIVALRKLDQYRGNRMWAPEKQKAFYSGVTDTLREYMAGRYGVGAMEMTTAEIFAQLKDTDAPKELLDETRELFERADFVKFAKYVASDEDNASALPVAVRFVTETYQAEVEAEADTSEKEGGE